MHELDGYFGTTANRTLEELFEFLKIPSVSADRQYQHEVRAAACFLVEQLERAGLADPQLYETAGNPIVYAEWLDATGAPTVLVYGHYDVQPPDPLSKWVTPPFEPTLRGGHIYARGVSDDKAPLFIAIKVAQAYFAMCGKLPVNVKFLFEGEEEIGSPNLEPFIKRHADMLKADFVLSADGAMWRSDHPTLNISSRGLVALELGIRGPHKDLHSGRHGGAVANPLHAMAQLIASLHDDEGRVAVAGFYDDVLPMAEEARASTRSIPFDEQSYLYEIGSPELYGEADYTTLERLWNRPTLEVNGMWGGYQGQGSKTVIPSEAHAKITCRLVANQDPGVIIRRLTNHFQRHLPRGVTLDTMAEKYGARAYRIPNGHKGLRAAQETLEAYYDKEPWLIGMGGSVPICETFQAQLGMDTVFLSFAVGDENIHAPNEFFRIHRLHEGLQVWARYWQALADKN
jgi:acetylornithine deacetylase/succinyl-diaminopimelate desuccinylase-like protein